MAILGIDEVGRGPLAGPLVVGAVILPRNEFGWLPEWTNELRDSKKLSAKRRENLNSIIIAEAPFGLGWVRSDELDELGISEALKTATRRAVKEVQKKAKDAGVSFSQIIIDGKINFLSGTKLERFVSTAVKADDLIKEVSAASIVAKVARDSYMISLAEKYIGYGFEKNVGYGTTAHLKAISEIGICPEHRKSFEPIKSMVGFERADISRNVVKNTTTVGGLGEAAVCEYLGKLGHKIVARNFKTKLYEIDIVSVFEDKIYFTEVKTRSSRDFGGGFMAINAKKLKQMEFAAESFLKFRTEFSGYNPILAAADVDGDFRVLDWVSIK